MWKSMLFAGRLSIGTTVIGVMVFNATFSNMSVKSWLSVLLMEKTGVPGENHRQVTDKLNHIMLYRVHLTIIVFKLTTLVGIGTDCTGSCKSNYLTVMTMTAPNSSWNYKMYYIISFMWQNSLFIRNYLIIIYNVT